MPLDGRCAGVATRWWRAGVATRWWRAGVATRWWRAGVGTVDATSQSCVLIKVKVSFSLFISNIQIVISQSISINIDPHVERHFACIFPKNASSVFICNCLVCFF